MNLRVICLACLVLYGCDGAPDRTEPASVSTQREAEPLSELLVACADCRIRLSPIVTVGSASDPVSLDLLPSAARLPASKRVIAGPLLQKGELAVYESGRFLRTVGRFGDGPTEIRSVRNLRVWEDTVLIFQEDRLTFLAPDLIPMRSVRLPIPPREVAVLSDGSVLILHQLPEIAPSQLVRVHRDGAADTIRLTESSIIGGLSASNGGFWVVTLNDHVATQYDSHGVVRRRIAHSHDWFVAWSEIDYNEPMSARPRPRTVAISEDEDGLLWTLSLVADEDWQPFESGDDPSY